jgi:replicative DNA helicase
MSDDRRTVDGWTFVRGATEKVPAVWGEGDAIAQAQGEPVMIVGPDGVGKTSVGQQLVLHRLGVRRGRLLGLPVARTEGKVLYLAADRPAQAARSMRRMVNEEHEELLRERLVVHRGALPFELLKEPADTLRQWVQDHRAGDLVIDSLKDVAPKLTDDETGLAINRAFQEVVAAGIELAALHHQRKALQGMGAPKSLADVYGSRWLTACCGSVLLLWGDPGDLVVSLKHLKQPMEEIGPFNVLHDHTRGLSTLHETTNLEQIIAPTGLTVKQAAMTLYGNDAANDVEKARRKLNSLIGQRKLERRDDPDGTARYFPRTPS